MTVDDLPSFHSDFLDTTSDSPITFKKPEVLLKSKNPIIDISSESASKISKKSKTTQIFPIVSESWNKKKFASDSSIVLSCIGRFWLGTCNSKQKRFKASLMLHFFHVKISAILRIFAKFQIKMARINALLNLLSTYFSMVQTSRNRILLQYLSRKNTSKFAIFL